MRQNPGDTLYNLTVTVNVAGMEVVELIGPADADRSSIMESKRDVNTFGMDVETLETHINIDPLQNGKPSDKH